MDKCNWCKDGGINEEYHDREWGIPLHDDRKHFEFLMMEVMQCGLNWTMMLKKRKTFCKCFDNFDYEKIALYGDADIERIMGTEDMIKSVRKIRAVIDNARAYKKIIDEFSSFDRFLWGYSGYKSIVYENHRIVPVASNDLSDAVSKELKKRGFKYLGSTTVYSHLQACGIINDHDVHCFRYQQVIDEYPVEFR
ncbi:DNA-3-methyladenine glycosylase I [Kineothrix alysoides]|uniref:DNA-3-methyladenine glycosylase I n=1 Tax=Kineothrix alysoides TaxID=1469948 RepID=A0A4R1QYM8_9FIRM|nr:DNA-3-methyladenine glycosylase I [Kineothrix alysoides]TCL58060.1 DNA-3-methyladenine glycosylase I [Kineothrix alysoides]